MLEHSQKSPSFINLGIVFNEKGEVLMIKRKLKDRKQNDLFFEWIFPGGEQESKEITRQDSLRKHIFQETGYDVQWVKQIDLAFYPQTPVFIAYHLCSLLSSNSSSASSKQNNALEIKWVKPETIKELMQTPLNPKVAKVLGI